MCSLWVVLDNLCSSLKLDIIMLIILLLNSFSVTPIYVSCFPVFLCMIVAWYRTPFWRHQPRSGNFTVLFAPLHFFFVAEDRLIVASDDLVYDIHTAKTQFDCFYIDDFIEFVFWWEARTEETEEFFSSVGGNVFAIWRVEPSNFSSFAFADSFYFIILYVLGRAHVFLGALSECFRAFILYIFIFAVHQYLFISVLFRASLYGFAASGNISRIG